MRIPSGVTDQVIYFVAVDATDLKTRETGLSSFTVYRSRNGGTATAMTTPTVTEVDATNMPGVYKLLCDEDMTIDTGDDSQEMCFHITQASMAPVTRVIEIYRPKITAGNTLAVASDGDVGGNVDGNVVGSVASVTGNVGGNVVGSVASVTGNINTAAGTLQTLDALDTAQDTQHGTTQTHLTDIKGATFLGATDSLEAIRDRGDAAWLTATGFSTLTQADIRTAVGLASANLDTQLAAIAGFIDTEIAAILSDLADIKGATFDTLTDSLEAIRNRGDAAWLTATGFSTHNAADVWAVATRLLTAGTNIVLAKGVGVTGFNDLSAAQMNAEVVDALSTDAYGEPGQTTPSVSLSIKDKIGFLYKFMRNKIEQTATEMKVYNDDGTTVAQKSTVSDDGTTYTRGEFTTGP